MVIHDEPRVRSVSAAADRVPDTTSIAAGRLPHRARDHQTIKPVLIVDDDVAIRQLYTLVLTEAGIATVAVADGTSALAYLHDHDVSMLLLELSMPGMNGTEVLEHLNEDPRTRGLPVILLLTPQDTASADTEDRVRGLDAGADDYLVKPIDHAELVAHVRAVLRGRAGEAELRRVVDAANDAYIAWDASGCIIEWNARATETFGWERPEAIGRPFAQTVIAERHRHQHETSVRRFSERGETPLRGEWVELPGLHRNGHEVSIEMTIWAVVSAAGFSFHSLLRDVSHRVGLEAAFEQSATHRQLNDGSPDVVTLSDASGLFYVSPACETMLGYEPAEFLGDLMMELLFPDDRETVRRAYLDALDSGGNLFTSFRIRAKDGHYVWVEARGCAVREHNGGAGIVLRTIWRDVSEHVLLAQQQERATEVLEASNTKLANTLDREQHVVEQLKALDRAKSDFVSTVSHELRTPLTSITGYTEILADESATRLDADQQRAVAVIERNSVRLLAMIDDLEILSRVESGSLKVLPTSTRLGQLIEAATNAVAPLARKQELGLTVAIPGDLPEVLADPVHIDRVLLNLLSNAIKFTPSGGQVEVDATDLGGHVAVTVRDNGMGIPEHEQGQLFERFSRARAAKEAAIQGSGLGLFIVANIVELHGGTVSLGSCPDQGTEVTFTLPCARAEAISAIENRR